MNKSFKAATQEDIAVEVIDAIDAAAFEKARDMIASIKNRETAEELSSLCFHDYLWLAQPSQAEVDSYISASPAPLKNILKSVYEQHQRFMTVLGGAS